MLEEPVLAPAVQQLRHDELEESRRWLNTAVGGSDPKSDPNKLTVQRICAIRVFHDRAVNAGLFIILPSFVTLFRALL